MLGGWQEIRKKVRWYDFLVLILVILGVVLLVIGGLENLSGDKTEVEYIASNGVGLSGEKIMVDVEGAVINPGVYELAADARLKDGLAAAGGLAAGADRDYVARTINLADKVKDGQKIFIPTKMNDAPGGIEQNEANSVLGYSGGVLVNINTATLNQLDGLWGVGEVRAKAIIDNRPYSSVEELLSKGVLPTNVFERIKEEVSVY